jgi:nucleoside transporter
MAHGGTSAASAPPLRPGLRLNLSVMMFLQFAIWGAWFTVLGNRLDALGLSNYIGRIFGTMALGTIFTPLFVGQIADRYFSSEKLMALLHLAGAAFLYWLATIPPVPPLDPTLTGTALEAAKAARDAQVAATASQFFWIALVYAFIYSPTLALSNSIAFSHVPDATRDFPGLRVLGTIGWIVTGITVGKGLSLLFVDPKVSNGPLLLAAALSVLLGVYSLFLPHTPPKGQAGDAVPFLRALRLLKDPSFAVFFGVSFVITIVLAFYYNYTGLYLEKHIGVKDVASTMTIGQWSEMLLLPFLPLFLRWMGMKWVLAMGMLAWGLRYGVFAWGGAHPAGAFYWPVVLSLAFHGVCFDFFFAAGFIHVDNEAPSDIKGSAQSLFVFLTYGLGMWLGSELSNEIFRQTTQEVKARVKSEVVHVQDWYPAAGSVNYQITISTGGTSSVTNWTQFWAIPSIGVLIALAIFVAFFRLHPRKKEPAGLGWPPADRPLSADDPGRAGVHGAEQVQGAFGAGGQEGR